MMLAFEKWQGLGNDFIVVESGDPGAELAARLCDRRLGVGADGVLALESQGEDVRMIVRNADGSRPEMCGNGVRCVVGYVAARRGRARGELVIHTDAGPRVCGFERVDADGVEYVVTVAMGAARNDGPLVDPALEGRAFVRVDLGNPHAVSFEPFDDATLDRFGPALERSTPGGINVELCRVVAPTRLEVEVWERGCGRTQACGTGACAVAAAAVWAGRSPVDEPLEVHLPGGALTITVLRDTETVTMKGPAKLVFQGQTRVE